MVKIREVKRSKKADKKIWMDENANDAKRLHEVRL